MHAGVFRPDYAGYKPDVTEIPNSDGKADTLKRYAHIAPKYSPAPELLVFAWKAHAIALDAAKAFGVTAEFLPIFKYGALRILDYPPGAGSAEHTDFDLFTIHCYRDVPEAFIRSGDPLPEAVANVNADCHIGRLGEILGLGKAHPHHVEPTPVPQHAIVYFAIPEHDAVLPTGEVVRDWLNRIMAESRTSFKAYR
jgi:hypothetical protein